ncbi:MAG: SAV_915 family protein, partial [Actinomycetes bacterium]
APGGMPLMDLQPPVIVPPVLYLPVREHPEGGSFPEVRALRDGRAGLLANTALDRLADGCGEHQPWAPLHTSQLGEVKSPQPVDVVAFDHRMPSHLAKN